MTGAERKANALAERAKSLGLTAEIKISEEPAIYYPSSGEVMIPARTFVWVTVEDKLPRWCSSNLMAGWRTNRAEGRYKATTAFCGGHLYRFGRKGQRLRRERDVAHWVDIFGI